VSDAPAPGHERRWELLCWAFALLAVAYAAAVHHGIGPRPMSLHLDWYQPRGFLEEWDWLSWAFEPPRRLFVVLTLPVLALTAAVFITGRSALPRALALSSVVATLLFCFYGVIAQRIWEFFFWRASAVLVLMSLAVGFAMAAPFLAASWLRLGWPLRLALYLPVCFAVVAFIRNATGTDLNLRFAISPWPAVPVFGIEVGALFVMVWLLGAAIGVAGLAWARAGGPRVPAILGGIALAIAVPVALLAAGSALSMLPFRAGAGTLLAVAVACALAVALAGTVGVRRRAEALRERAVHLAVGAALIALPLLSAEAWARWDYYTTREHRAGELIDAMQRYYEKEDIYPDELDELVAGGYLDRLPEPAIGFGFLYDGRFRYRSFGTSYILEFPAPRWVECAYNPPYEDEDGEEGEEAVEEREADEELEAWETADYAAPGAGESLGGAWSCPSRPPELW
jgi:hypothetical protein